MTKTRKYWWLELLLLALLLAGIVLLNFNSVKVSTASVYSLTPARLSHLEQEVESKKDVNAAWRIALHYERNRHDSELYYYWLSRAATLGHRDAANRLEHIHKCAREDKDNGTAIDAEIAALVENGRQKQVARNK